MPPKLKNKIATSSHILSLSSIHHSIKTLKEVGYDAIEIWSEELEFQLKNEKTSIDKIKKALKDNDMIGVIHAPLRDLVSGDNTRFNICSKNKELRNKTLNKTLLSLQYAKNLGFNVVTVHPGHVDRGDKLDDEYWSLQIDSFKILAKKAEELGIRIGIEPMQHKDREFVTEPIHTDKIIREVNSENLGVTFDIVHAYTHGIDKPIEFLDGHKHLFHVHVSGFAKDKGHVHFALTEIHHFYLDKVFKALVDRNYQGIISIEGTIKDLMEFTLENQLMVVKNNLSYVHSDLKALHLE